MKIYNVAEVAERLKISKQTLLRYEKKGILPSPNRNRINNWREYREDDIRKIEQILGRAFTLIELVMVMVILGILAVLSVPRIESFNSIKLKAAAIKTGSDIRYVQQFSVSRHASSRITFNIEPANYYLAEEEFP
ncbi:MAG: MerR family transcriptional regulator, partial [Candidatus Omnitrophica bacterium]|nr:MerR family transcriptional regulator [Candidatus Omnitrophota bacterium]